MTRPEWPQPLEQGLQTSPNELVAWWRVFNDPVLNELIEIVRKNNTLEIAALRVLEDRAQLGIATGLLYPQTQVAVGEATRVSPADNTGVTSDFWQYGLGLTELGRFSVEYRQLFGEPPSATLSRTAN